MIDEQIFYALERQISSLRSQGDELCEQKDVRCEFFYHDAENLERAKHLLKSYVDQEDRQKEDNSE